MAEDLWWADGDYAYSIQQTSDGGYIVAGVTGLLVQDGDAWVLKLDGSGNVQWQKTYGGTGWDYAATPSSRPRTVDI